MGSACHGQSALEFTVIWRRAKTVLLVCGMIAAGVRLLLLQPSGHLQQQRWVTPLRTMLGSARRSGADASFALAKQASVRTWPARSELVLSEHLGAAGEKRRIHAEARV